MTAVNNFFITHVDSPSFQRALDRPVEIRQQNVGDQETDRAAQGSLRLRDWNWRLINPRYAYLVKRALIVTALALTAVVTPWKPLRIWGITVLTAATYGIINNLFACRTCPEFFTVGLRYDEQRTRYRLVKTLDPNINALAWGLVATMSFAAIGGVILSTVAAMTGSDEKKLIVMLLGHAALTFLVADLSSRFVKARHREGSIVYPGVPSRFQAQWFANNTRNGAGYLGFTAGIIAFSILMIKNYLDKAD